MKSLRKFALQVFFVASFLCNSAMAAYIDFTDSNLFLLGNSSVFAGSVDGIGFMLTSSGINRTEVYDGSSTNPGCQAGGVGGQLTCGNDGIGIGNDEITTGQTLNLIFNTAVRITSIEFLDLYEGVRAEEATVSIDGGISRSVIATGSSGDGGYANLDFLALVGADQNIEFTARNLYGDDGNNDYALAAITVSAVPVPAAIWLFGTGLIGLIGFSKRRKAA